MSVHIMLLKPPTLPAPPFDDLDPDACLSFGAFGEVHKQLAACLPDIDWQTDGRGVTRVGDVIMEIALESRPDGAGDAVSPGVVECISLVVPTRQAKKAKPILRQLCSTLGAVAVDCQDGDYVE
ncbi:MAG TPA: hypothetical protein PKC45_18100 [Gemmatales bacterium]|nr:hypothetical protein [Gemmatales bacterium]